jgi:ABC-type lipoprotein export system ATPase subunit
MNIEISNCNNIDTASILIKENKLNIKYAMNGTGKSTIAKAIELCISGGDGLKQLTPFKYINSTSDNETPSVKGLEKFTQVRIFDDSYINQYAFKPDEILANSFEIFVKTADYEEHMKKIEAIIANIKATFKSSKEIDQVINDLGVLSDCFGKSKTGYSESGAIAKGLGKGNKVSNVPKGLESFSAYLRSSMNVKWLRWQMEGNTFSTISSNCPYCTSPTEDKKVVISKVSDEYDAKSIEHLNKIIVVLDNLSNYFSEDANKKLTRLVNNANGLSKEEINYLVQIKLQVDTLKDKMLNLKGLTYFSIRDADQIADHFKSLKIDLEYLADLDSNNTRVITERINNSLDEVLTKIGVLKGEIAQQTILIRKTISDNNSAINEFLRCAGYKYSVDVEYEKETYKMKLKHFDFSQSVPNAGQHLSYGEKNAFSIVLFMFECLAKNPDLIILDDPISSFDKNKKYAVMDMLFKGKKSLRGKSVLMLTHDLEPVIDILYTLKRNFTQQYVTFIEIDKGVISEIEITKADISTFSEICLENINNNQEDIVKLVYLRRYFEIISNKGLAYELLSNLLHKRDKPIKMVSEQSIPMTENEISEASEIIMKKHQLFNYKTLLTKISNQDYLMNAYKKAKYNYEKLQIFRVLLQDNIPDTDIIKKYINEAFHIENEYIMQVNPCKFEIVPSFIIDECDKMLSNYNCSGLKSSLESA